MGVFDIFLYKLENFLNARPQPRTFGGLFYREDEPSLCVLSARKRRGAALALVRWGDLFSAERLVRRMACTGLSAHDCYTVTVFLARLGYLFQIDRRARLNKDYFIFFYVIQLIALKNNPVAGNDAVKNHALRFLLFELCMEYDEYMKIRIENDRLVLRTEAGGCVDFLAIIAQMYGCLEIEKRAEHALLDTIRQFHGDAVRFLAVPDGAAYPLPFNDRALDLLAPHVFLETAAARPARIFDAVIEAVAPDQSTNNRFVSAMILMNYAFYCLKETPKAILKLKRYANDERVFTAVLAALIHRGLAVNRPALAALGLESYLAGIADSATAFDTVFAHRAM